MEGTAVDETSCGVYRSFDEACNTEGPNVDEANNVLECAQGSFLVDSMDRASNVLDYRALLTCTALIMAGNILERV